MAKGKKAVKGKSRRPEPKGLPAELEDEVDVFHKGREKISLDKSEDRYCTEDSERMPYSDSLSANPYLHQVLINGIGLEARI